MVRHLFSFLILIVALPLKAAESAIPLENIFQTFQKTPIQQRCSPKSQIHKLGPTRDQGFAPWCFAYAAADLATYEMNLGPKEQVSALWMGAGFKSTTSAEIQEIFRRNRKKAGKTDDLARLQELKDARIGTDDFGHQFFLANYLTADEYAGAKQALGSAKESGSPVLQDQSGGYVENALEVFFNQNKVCTTRDLKDYENSRIDALTSLATLKHRAQKLTVACPRGPRRDPVSSLWEFSGSVMDNQVKLLSRNCSLKSQKLAGRTVESVEFRRTEEPMNSEVKAEALWLMNEILNQNQIFAISYDARVLTTSDPGNPLNHASSLIGRKPINGKCYYQVRNSWGSSCEYYKKNDPRVICEHGGSIFVDEEHLLSHLYGIQYIDKP